MNEMTLFVIISSLIGCLILTIIDCLRDSDSIVLIFKLFFLFCFGAILLIPFWIQHEMIFGQYDSIKEDLKNPYFSVSTERIQNMNARLYSYQKDYQDGEFLTRFVFGDKLIELEFIEMED